MTTVAPHSDRPVASDRPVPTVAGSLAEVENPRPVASYTQTHPSSRATSRPELGRDRAKGKVREEWLRRRRGVPRRDELGQARRGPTKT